MPYHKAEWHPVPGLAEFAPVEGVLTSLPPSLEKVAISLQERPEKMIISSFFAKKRDCHGPQKIGHLARPDR